VFLERLSLVGTILGEDSGLEPGGVLSMISKVGLLPNEYARKPIEEESEP